MNHRDANRDYSSQLVNFNFIRGMYGIFNGWCLLLAYDRYVFTHDSIFIFKYRSTHKVSFFH